MKKVVAHGLGAAGSVGSGLLFAKILPYPFGLSAGYFNILAPLAGFAGYEIGRQLGIQHYKPWWLLVFSIILVPLCFFAYDSLIHVAAPTITNNLLIFMFFSLTIFCFSTALGILGLKLEDVVGK